MAEIYQHGQVVIPKYIRDMFGLMPGARVRFSVKDNEIRICPEEDVMAEFERLTSGAGASFEETERLIRKTEGKRKKEWLDVP